MVQGNLFNKGVKALDAPHVGHVVRDTKDMIVIFGDGDERYDVPKSAIRFVSGNVLLDMPFHDVVRKYKVDRQAPLPTGSTPKQWSGPRIDPAEYEKQSPKSYNKAVWSDDTVHIGHVVKETDDKIVVLGHYDWRFDIPKSEMKEVGEDIGLKLNYDDVFKYKVDENSPLPTGEPYEKVADFESD